MPRKKKINLTSKKIEESFLLSIISKTPAMIVVYNIKTGQYIFVNDAIKQLLGYSSNEFIEKGLPFVASLIHPDDIEHISKKNSKALKKANSKKYSKDMYETIMTFEYRMKHNNGEWRWLHSDGTVFDRDGKGKVEYVMNVVVDITERKNVELAETEKRVKAEKKAREGEERYKTFILLSSEAIWRFEVEKPISIKLSAREQIKQFYKYAYLAECNDAMARMYGYKKCEEIQGARLGDLLIESDKGNSEYLKAFIKSGYNLSVAESHEVDRNGNLKYFSNNLVGVVEDGYIVRAWGSQRDITEQKRIEQELRASKDQLQTIFEGITDGITMQDATGKLIFANPAAAKTSGYKSVEHMITNPRKFLEWFDIQNEEGESFPFANYPGRRALKGEKEPVATFRFIEKKTGRERWSQVKASPIFGSDKKVLYAINIIHDITERKKLEEQKDEFIAIASHELKTPVTSIKAFAQAMQNRFAKAGDEKNALLLGKMNGQLDKLTFLIRDLLDVTKIETGKLLFQEGYFDLDELITEIIEEMQRTTDVHTIKQELTRTKSIFGDRDRIGQVLTNLISNAIKYSPDNKDIIVSSTDSDDRVTICVKDFGPGIPKDKVDKIFERFFRVEGSERASYPGLGLGLYISSEIIKRHGGKIWVENGGKNKGARNAKQLVARRHTLSKANSGQAGGGATFCFQLPVKSNK